MFSGSVQIAPANGGGYILHFNKIFDLLRPSLGWSRMGWYMCGVGLVIILS